MSAHSSPKHSVGNVIEVSISKPGKLGIEFRQTASPYFVIRISEDARALYDVVPGDLLVEVKREADLVWTQTEGLSWADLVDVLKHRPARCKFMRSDSSPKHDISLNEPDASANSPVKGLHLPVNISLTSPVISPTKPLDVSPVHLPAFVKSPVNVVRPMGASQVMPIVPDKPPPLTVVTHDKSPANMPVASVSPRNIPRATTSPFGSTHTVVYSSEGPLGLEFEAMDFPFKVGGVKSQSMSDEKGVRKGDSLLTVNGKSAEGMVWEEVRKELSTRPSVVVFKRAPQSTSLWGLASNLVSSDPRIAELENEVDHLKHIIGSLGGEDLEALKLAAAEGEKYRLKSIEAERELATMACHKESILATIEEERVKNSKLVDVISEIERGQQELVSQFEKEIHERDMKIRNVVVVPKNDESAILAELRKELDEQSKLLEAVEVDNTRLRKECTELGTMVTQCLETIEKDMAGKPHWVDRRVVCSAIATLLREVAAIDMNEGEDRFAAAHASARQRLGDVLGLTFEERSAMGLLKLPSAPTAVEEPRQSISSAFVDFLERESTKNVPEV